MLAFCRNGDAGKRNPRAVPHASNVTQTKRRCFSMDDDDTSSLS